MFLGRACEEALNRPDRVSEILFSGKRNLHRSGPSSSPAHGAGCCLRATSWLLNSWSGNQRSNHARGTSIRAPQERISPLYLKMRI
eukprot:1186552-Prorocentrum_minimum.AAC.2